MGDLDPLVRLEGVRSGEGVCTAVEAAVVPAVAEGVELATESLRCCSAAEDEFNSEVTSIAKVGMTTKGSVEATRQFDDCELISLPSMNGPDPESHSDE